jgi:hypothetical protein
MRQSKNEKQENASGDDTAELNPQSKFKEKIIVLKNIGVLRLLIAAGSKAPKSAEIKGTERTSKMARLGCSGRVAAPKRDRMVCAWHAKCDPKSLKINSQS